MGLAGRKESAKDETSAHKIEPEMGVVGPKRVKMSEILEPNEEEEGNLTMRRRKQLLISTNLFLIFIFEFVFSLCDLSAKPKSYLTRSFDFFHSST